MESMDISANHPLDKQVTASSGEKNKKPGGEGDDQNPVFLSLFNAIPEQKLARPQKTRNRATGLRQAKLTPATPLKSGNPSPKPAVTQGESIQLDSATPKLPLSAISQTRHTAVWTRIVSDVPQGMTKAHHPQPNFGHRPTKMPTKKRTGIENSSVSPIAQKHDAQSPITAATANPAKTYVTSGAEYSGQIQPKINPQPQATAKTKTNRSYNIDRVPDLRRKKSTQATASVPSTKPPVAAALPNQPPSPEAKPKAAAHNRSAVKAAHPATTAIKPQSGSSARGVQKMTPDPAKKDNLETSSLDFLTAVSGLGDGPASAPQPLAGIQSNATQAVRAAMSGIDLARSVAGQITQNIPAKDGTMTEISLDPAKLGKVRLRLHTTDIGVQLQIIAERPETTDLMRRHLPGLTAEFQDLGYQNIGFSFSDSRQNHSNQETPAPVPTTPGGPVFNDITPSRPDIAITKLNLKSDELDLRL